MANGTLAASQIEMLSQSGTGIITITPPATNTNRAITLPDAAGAIVVSGTTPSLNGITFPATQVASAGANTLDDYEEGTWTPVIYGSSSAGTATYSTQTGSYIKVGNLVTVRALISYSGHTGTGFIQMSGLPFGLPSDQTLQWNCENLVLTAGSFPAIFAFGFFYNQPGGATTTFNAVNMDAAASIYIVGSSYILS